MSGTELGELVRHHLQQRDPDKGPVAFHENHLANLEAGKITRTQDVHGSGGYENTFHGAMP